MKQSVNVDFETEARVAAERLAEAEAALERLERLASRRWDTIQHYTKRAATAEAARDDLAKALDDALELIDDLRSYASDWDWKYGEEWDEQRATLAHLETGSRHPEKG